MTRMYLQRITMISILIIIITTYRKYNMKHKNRKNTMKKKNKSKNEN